MKRTSTEKKLELTPNARIVLEKRYLKPNETPEKLLWRVARNVALADIIYDKNIEAQAVYKNVARVLIPAHDTLSSDLSLLHGAQCQHSEKLKAAMDQFAAALPVRTANSPEVKKTISDFYEFLNSGTVKNYDENFKTFLDNLNELYDSSECARKSAEEFFDIMLNLEFLPNSPTLMNAGSTLQQLSAC
ncbi:MAG TPA: ribonucleotide reductase N-terminal alpha domain-containing protein, partial [Candidatus Wallbacteria bacterium]|nr:ribonucleotide reductase N-terminal alpha domain-containing protein [Candidatus Wallbacteria bacterium]